MHITVKYLLITAFGLLLFVPIAGARVNQVDNKVLATQLLRSIPVEKETTFPIYNRSFFKHWISVGSSGCNARQYVLWRDNLRVPKPSCHSKSGTWFSLYDGKKFTLSRNLDIDHMVPLAEAWRSGAAGSWDESTRQRYANDISYKGSLVPVSASSNRSKGDQDPARWMPPSISSECTYLVRWIAVKYRWKLSIDVAEKTALLTDLKSCPTLKTMLKMPPRAVITYDTRPIKPITPVFPTPPNKPDNNNGGAKLDPRFKTCTEAKKAGYGPYYKDKDQEYAWYIDRDKDGVACE